MTTPLDLEEGKRLLSEALPAPWVASRPFYSNRDLDAVAWLRNNADALLAAAERDEERENCYCACHSRVSSCPMCPHCEGAVRVMEAALLRERRVAAEDAEKLRKLLREVRASAASWDAGSYVEVQLPTVLLQEIDAALAPPETQETP